MVELQLFNSPEFGEIRTYIEPDGTVLFCGSDVAKALGYIEPHKAISRHCRGGAKRPVGVQTGFKADGTPSIQQMQVTFIPEGDIYRLTARSNLPTADKFERWIFDKRKTATKFATMADASFFGRRYLALRYGFLKSGLIRNAGLFFL